jgi:hypothetical protein
MPAGKASAATPEVDVWAAVCQTLLAAAEFRYLQ